MPIYTQGQIKDIWTSNGGPPGAAQIASAIAMAESGGKSDAVNDDPATGDLSVGLWQINYFGDLGPQRTAEYGPLSWLKDHLDAQVFAAINISSDATDWTPWSTYNDGAYLTWMPGQPGATPGTAGGFPGEDFTSLAPTTHSAWDNYREWLDGGVSQRIGGLSFLRDAIGKI